MNGTLQLTTAYHNQDPITLRMTECDSSLSIKWFIHGIRVTIP